MYTYKQVSMKYWFLYIGFALAFVNHSGAQHVVNGSINGGPTGVGKIANAVGWDRCAITPDLCAINWASYNGATKVTAIPSPDGGTWLGLFSYVPIGLRECAYTTMEGLTVGDTFSLRFYGACFGVIDTISSSNPANVKISVGTASDTFSIPMLANTWDVYSMTFEATSPIMTLEVENISGDNYASLDGFTLKCHSDERLNIGSDTSLCVGDTLILDATLDGTTYEWSGGFTGPILTVTKYGNYWVQRTDNCDTQTDIIEVAFYSPPPIEFGTDQILCPWDTLVLTPDIPMGTFLWQDGSGNATYNVTQSGTYWVNQMSLQGCSNSDTIHVEVEDCTHSFEIPNFFSPNGDGKNDLMIPINIRNVQSAETTIFNRWGREVYHTTDRNISWNGMGENDEKVSDGVYHWIIMYVDNWQNSYQIHGVIQVVR